MLLQIFRVVCQVLVLLFRLKQEKKELETMQNDAVIARDAAKEELVRLEKHLYEERKKREIELQQMKKEAEEKRIQQEKIMTRIVNIRIIYHHV